MRAKNEWVLKAYDQFRVDVANVSARDLAFIAPLLAKSDQARNSETYPLLNKLVSANIVSDSPAVVTPQKFIIREVSLRGATSGQKPFRIAFIGLSSKTEKLPTGFSVIDPIEAARIAVPEARRKADYVIVLAHVDSEYAPRIAREVEGIDVLIAGGTHLDRVFVPPVQVGKTFVVFSTYETRMIGELRLYRNAENRFSARARFVSIDKVIPNDAAAEELANVAGAAELDTRAEGKQLLEEWLVMSRARFRPGSNNGEQPQYVSSGACAQCHMKEYVQWSASRHRYASDPLAPKGYEFESSCLTCHASGSTENRLRLPQFQGVQCEECHGPGSLHAAKPAKGYGRTANMNMLCSKCHTPKTSPAFDPTTAWEKIKH